METDETWIGSRERFSESLTVILESRSDPKVIQQIIGLGKACGAVYPWFISVHPWLKSSANVEPGLSEPG